MEIDVPVIPVPTTGLKLFAIDLIKTSPAQTVRTRHRRRNCA